MDIFDLYCSHSGPVPVPVPDPVPAPIPASGFPGFPYALFKEADYMSRAGPVRRAGSFSRDPSTSEKNTKNQVCDYMEQIPARLTGLRFFHVNRVHRDSPVSRAFDF